MLDIIKHKINNIRTDCNSVDAMKLRLAGIVEDIESYQASHATLSEIHAVFRALDEYSNMYHAELTKYAAIPREDKRRSSYQIQEMICVLALMGSLLSNTLRRYTTAEDKSTLAKHLRKLNEISEYVRSEKIMWQSTLKSFTVLIQADMADMEYNHSLEE